MLRGERERVHGHNWRVTVCAAGPELDEDGLLVDFHALEGLVDRVIRPMRDGDLNETQPFDRVNPTAERLAEHIGESVSSGLIGADAAAAGRGVGVAWVRVTEAPGCAAVWRAGA